MDVWFFYPQPYLTLHKHFSIIIIMAVLLNLTERSFQCLRSIAVISHDEYFLCVIPVRVPRGGSIN